MRSVAKITKNCVRCNKLFSFKPYLKRIYCSRSCQIEHVLKNGRGKIRNYASITGKNNYAWKGEKVGYFGLHAWVNRKLGAPNKCEFCGITEGTFHWANKSHKYRRDLADWMRLCQSCHFKFDEVGKKSWIKRRLPA